MNINIDVRKKQLQSLDQYITSSRDKVESILNYLGWNNKRVLENVDQIVCPINRSHQIPLDKIDKHVEKCCKKSAGYTSEDEFLSEPSNDCKSSISLDTLKKVEILNAARLADHKFKPAWNGVDPDPLTCDRLLSTFSSDERLAVYNYCIQNTEAPPIPSEFTLNIDEIDKKEEKNLSQEEILQKERNARRRRTKHKSVHTGRNKSHTEVIREVISNQMELFEEYLVKKENQQKEEERLQLEEEMRKMEEEERKKFEEEQKRLEEEYAFKCGNSREKERLEYTDRPCSTTSRHSSHSEKSRGIHDYQYEKYTEYEGGIRDYRSPDYERRRDSGYHETVRKEKRERDRVSKHLHREYKNGYDKKNVRAGTNYIVDQREDIDMNRY